MNYCSYCGGPVTRLIPEGDDRMRFGCTQCGRIHYQNPKIVVGCIPVWRDRILLCRRNIEPQKGKWTLPAGYLENGETVRQGAARETLEETGAAVTSLRPYLLFDITHIHQVYLIFRGRLRHTGFHSTPESSDVRLFEQDEIPWRDIAFRAIEKSLRYFFDDRGRGRFPFRESQIDGAGLSGPAFPPA